MEHVSQQDEVTRLLDALQHGDRAALDRLFPLVYEELRRIAHHHLRDERPGHTLGTTGLVHETYLKLVDQTRTQWRDRGHFFRVASWAMRRILVDYARSYRALRRGGNIQRVPLENDVALNERGETLEALDEALDRLAAVDERLSQVVECRYFGGLTTEETAEALGVSARTVERDWIKARGWLQLVLSG